MVNTSLARYKIAQGVWLELDLLISGGTCASADGGVAAAWWTLMEQSSPPTPSETAGQGERRRRSQPRASLRTGRLTDPGGCTAAKYSNRYDRSRPQPTPGDRLTSRRDLSDRPACSSGRRVTRSCQPCHSACACIPTGHACSGWIVLTWLAISLARIITPGILPAGL
jgi:hypothetical protein